MSPVHYVYWVCLSTHTDLEREGYVGVSINPWNRFKQHKTNCQSTHHRYNKDFKKHLRDEEVLLKVLVQASEEYCYTLEHKLRPMINIGWNQAVGGNNGSNYTHGLTGHRYERLYRNMLHKSKKHGKTVCDAWLGDSGFTCFINHIEAYKEERGEFILLEQSAEYSPETFKKRPRSMFMRELKSVYEIDESGKRYSIAELSEIFNIRPNTISSSIRNGWTVRQALGLDSKIKGQLQYKDKCISYNGSLINQEHINAAGVILENGGNYLNVADSLKLSYSDIRRVLFKLEMKPEPVSIKDLHGNLIQIKNSRVSPEVWEEIRGRILEGKNRSQVAKSLKLPVSTVFLITKQLGWERLDDHAKNSVG